MIQEKTNSSSQHGANMIMGTPVEEKVNAHGRYTLKCFDKNGKLKWEDVIENIVCTEGKDAALTHFLKGSSYSATVRMGLISNSNYSATAAGNTAANITTASGSPTNGWNEAASSVCASRGTPTFGTASSGSLALSSALSFSIIGSATIKGVFLMIPSAAGTAPSSTVGNTNGAIYSAGEFSGIERIVTSGDTINVTYSAGL
jgi:hypothetical protein